MRKTLISVASALLAIVSARANEVADTICGSYGRPAEWNIGAEINGGYVPSSGGFLRGNNPENRNVNSTMGVDLRLGFTSCVTAYPGIYQGIGVGIADFGPDDLLGRPFTAYIFQGMPVVKFADGLSLNYEWKFGVAAGWRHDVDEYQINAAVSTPVTALLGIGLKMQWEVNERVRLWAGIDARHYSNGNTSFPNKGVNSIGGVLGMSYVLTSPQPAARGHVSFRSTSRWMWDMMAYGAWRKRVVSMDTWQQVCPGRFAIAGLQLARLRQMGRWVAVGPSLDMQWDESGSLAGYWVDGTYGEDIKFYRPPFGKQIKVGVSAHVELTTPIFHVNAGVGYDFVNPRGDKRLYQSLSLKTFVMRGLYLNAGYRLGDFSTPQNLMLGVGFQF